MPDDLDQVELEAVLERRWGVRGATLDYLPVGFGSHHWRAVDARGVQGFVTVDDLEAGFQASPDTDSAFLALDRAYRTAVELRDAARLDFVAAPLVDDEGAVIVRLSARYAVTLSRFIDGESSAQGSYESRDDRRRMGEVVGRLHAATEHVSADLPRREDFAIPSRALLIETLHDLDRPWSSGPFAEQARQLLRANARDVERRLDEYDELAEDVHASPDPWVVTHGEPHNANVIHDRQGRIHLVDWDTTLFAPRERDLRMVLDTELTGWHEYVAVTGADSVNEEIVELYSRWWDLAEIAVYTKRFRDRHERTADTVKSWHSLTRYLTAP